VATADEKLKALYEEIGIAREELQSLKDQQEAADFGDRRIQTLNQPILHTPNVILQRASNEESRKHEEEVISSTTPVNTFANLTEITSPEGEREPVAVQVREREELENEVARLSEELENEKYKTMAAEQFCKSKHVPVEALTESKSKLMEAAQREKQLQEALTESQFQLMKSAQQEKQMLEAMEVLRLKLRSKVLPVLVVREDLNPVNRKLEQLNIQEKKIAYCIGNNTLTTKALFVANTNTSPQELYQKSLKLQVIDAKKGTS
jgi:hypothetical protein